MRINPASIARRLVLFLKRRRTAANNTAGYPTRMIGGLHREKLFLHLQRKPITAESVRVLLLDGDGCILADLQFDRPATAFSDLGQRIADRAYEMKAEAFLIACGNSQRDPINMADARVLAHDAFTAGQFYQIRLLDCLVVQDHGFFSLAFDRVLNAPSAGS